MQLKRDTDYAFRLLLCVAQYGNEARGGMSVSELSRRTAIPPTITRRLCRIMAEGDLLDAVRIKKNVNYRAAPNYLNTTLWDVIQVIEGDNSIFAVFDSSSEMYTLCHDYFVITDHLIGNVLKHITIGEIKKKAEQA